MINRVNKVLIGKNISRTASAVLTGASQAAAQGEIFVLDKNKNILATGATISDTDTIYIAEVLGDTYNYVTEGSGTSVTGVKKYIVSDPIQGQRVRSYVGRPYTAIVEEVVTLVGSTFAPVVGTAYSIRIVYTDTFENPGQVTETYTVVATTTTVGDLYVAFVTLINKRVNRRVIASGTTSLVLTGRPMPFDRSDDVNAIDDYYQVTFKVALYSNNMGDVAITYTTRPVNGEGTWQKVRDAEKKALSYKGIMNRTVFPISYPAMRTVASTNYNCIAIEQDEAYTSATGSFEDTKATTELYIPSGAGQLANVLAVLNPWMSSLPNAFNGITF